MRNRNKSRQWKLTFLAIPAITAGAMLMLSGCETTRTYEEPEFEGVTPQHQPQQQVPQQEPAPQQQPGPTAP